LIKFRFLNQPALHSDFQMRASNQISGDNTQNVSNIIASTQNMDSNIDIDKEEVTNNNSIDIPQLENSIDIKDHNKDNRNIVKNS